MEWNNLVENMGQELFCEAFTELAKAMVLPSVMGVQAEDMNMLPSVMGVQAEDMNMLPSVMGIQAEDMNILVEKLYAMLCGKKKVNVWASKEKKDFGEVLEQLDADEKIKEALRTATDVILLCSGQCSMEGAALVCESMEECMREDVDVMMNIQYEEDTDNVRMTLIVLE